MNGVTVLRCSPPIAPDPPSDANSHIPDARSGSGTLMTRLLQCSTGRHSNLHGTPFAVSAQCGGTTHLHLRPHDHISDALATLYWLQYKIAVLTFKVLHDSVPQYLGPLVTVADLPGQ